MPARRGFAFPATPDLELAATVSGSAEELGYSTVWCNDAPPGDGLAVAVAMLGATERIRVGVGAVACDRRPAGEIVDRLGGKDLPLDRLVVVVGSGASSGLQGVADAVKQLRAGLGPDLSVGVAAMGPNMCRLGGEIADLVLLNWMNPQRIAWAREQIRQGAEQRPAALRAPQPEVASYIRVSVGQGAGLRVAAEASRYAEIPPYGRNFAAMGVASVGIAAPDPAGAAPQLEPYEAELDEAIIRCIVTVPASANPELNEVFEALGVIMEVQSLFALTPAVDGSAGGEAEVSADSAQED